MSTSAGPPLRAQAAYQRVNQFRFSVELFRRNYTELLTFLDYFCAPQVAFSYSPVEEKWLWHAGMREIGYLLHNFVAAAHSLVDHTRALYRQLYEPNQVLSEFPSEVADRFSEDPLSQFVIKLRQMAQHYRLPSLRNTTEVKNIRGGIAGDVRISLMLQKSDLVQFGGWNAPAKRFLDESPEEIDLRAVITAYYDHVASFHEWFTHQQQTLHGAGPDIYQHLLKHGPVTGPRREIAALDEAIAALEGQDREKITFGDLEQAFRPVLSIIDDRMLLLCRYDGRVWIRTALAFAKSRFDIPEQLEARILNLLDD